MNKLSAALFACTLAPAVAAQACFESDLGISLGSAADIVHPAQAIGFNFPIDGVTYSDIHISDHGVVWFSNGGVPAPPAGAPVVYNVLLADFAAFGPCIGGFWADATSGGAPNVLGEVWINNTDPTKCVITWVNMYTFFNIPPAYSFQVVIKDTGEVTMVWDANVNNYGSTFAPNAIVGITPGQGAILPASSDLSTGPITADPSIFEEFTTPSSFDMAADGVQFIPTSPGWVAVPLGGNANCASIATFGEGCVRGYATVYEEMPAATFDLAGATITALRSGNSYLMLDTIPGTFVTPSAAATVVAAGDDVEQTVALSGPMPIPGGTTNDLTIMSNGVISLGATGNGTAFTPDIPTWLGYTIPAVAPMWHDFQPNAAGSGQITYEEIGGIAYVTWNNVYNWGQTTGETFQVQFNVTTGDITIVYDPVHNNAGIGYLVGITGGNGPLSDPGANDLSVDLAGTLEVNDTETLPLSLDANAPRLGTNWNITTSNIDPLSPISVTFFGNAQGPGLPLTSLGINAPGCSVWINTIVGTVDAANVGGTSTATIGVPTNPALIGQVLTGQSICLTLQNPASLLASNGIEGTLGQ